MGNDQNINKFIIFCLENYKSALNLSGVQALSDFKDYDVFTYLSNGYEVLHTQGKDYIINDIKDFIAHRKNA
ncbi:hypothetical protein AGMMS49525_05210 [Bacteroidia bacterium]|nr:hypothetical protein AGMMS49525_05210 [Bacteroidia bacterium]